MTAEYAPPPAQATEKNGFGITALCLAIPGLVFGFIPLTGFVALILGALALIFGLLGVARVRKGMATNRVMSWVGTILAVGAIALGIWGITIVFQATDQFVRDMDRITNQGAPVLTRTF